MKVVNCPYCSYEFAIEELFFKDGWSLIHECVNCEDEYLITGTNVQQYKYEGENIKCKLALVDKLICVETLTNEQGVVFSEEGTIWSNTYYGTLTSVRLVRKRANGIPEWLTVTYDLLEKHFEDYKEGNY